MPFIISFSDTYIHISINSLGPFLSPECLFNFLSNLYIPTCMGKLFKFMLFRFLENVFNLGIFTHSVPAHSKFCPKFLSPQTRQTEIIHSPRKHFFENLFSPIAERRRGKYDLFCQNSIGKYDDLKYQSIYILYGLQFF